MVVRGKMIAVDIDGVLTVDATGYRYADRIPNEDNIEKVRELKKSNRIVLFTARYLEDKDITEEWLRKNNVPYDDLILGKPPYDVMIDDKAFNSFKEMEDRLV